MAQPRRCAVVRRLALFYRETDYEGNYYWSLLRRGCHVAVLKLLLDNINCCSLRTLAATYKSHSPIFAITGFVASIGS